MKKIARLFIVCICFLCCIGFYRAGRNSQNDDIKVYSFTGSNEMFAVLNGTVFLSDTEETFSGGDMLVKSDELFLGVTSFSTTFYTMDGGEKRIILYNGITELIDSVAGWDRDLGIVSADDLFAVDEQGNITGIEDNLYLELCTVDRKGKENTYQLLLELTEVT